MCNSPEASSFLRVVYLRHCVRSFRKRETGEWVNCRFGSITYSWIPNTLSVLSNTTFLFVGLAWLILCHYTNYFRLWCRLDALTNLVHIPTQIEICSTLMLILLAAQRGSAWVGHCFAGVTSGVLVHPTTISTRTMPPLFGTNCLWVFPRSSVP